MSRISLRRVSLRRVRLHRIATLLAILLLTLRVGTEAAVGCQHAVAESLARAAQTVQTAQAGQSPTSRAMSIAQLARGALCSVAYSGNAGPFDPARADAAAKHHQLAKSCPVFSAPAVLPQAIHIAQATPQVYSRNLILPEPWRATSKVERRAYHPRGPPWATRMLG